MPVTFTNGKYHEITVKMKPSISATTADLGKVIGADGQIYENAAAATNAGTTAKAMIAYVGNETGESAYGFTHGLAIALEDVANETLNGSHGVQYRNNINYKNDIRFSNSDSFGTESGIQYMSHCTESIYEITWPAFADVWDCNFKYVHYESAGESVWSPVPGCSMWFIGTGYQWKQMIASVGQNLHTTFSNLGGTNMSGDYWLSTMSMTGKAWVVTFGESISWGTQNINTNHYVRPVLAF